jgi:peptidoglycan/xylan/chitin deacetylase (PgdA/CDA1 family)
MAELKELRVVFLVGHDDENTRATIQAVCAIPGVRTAAVLLDIERPDLRRRLRNLRRNVRREGSGYIPRRVLSAIRGVTDRMVERAGAPLNEVDALLRKAYPQRCFSLDEQARQAGFTVHEVANLNSAGAAGVLAGCQADLGIVLGTRVLKASTFSVPRLGCINLHKGKVPEYRGMPPGFWELFDDAPAAGVTVHFVDSGLDSGDVVASSEIPVATRETPDTIRQKLDWEGTRVLAAAVASIQDGSMVRHPQPKTSVKPRTKPTDADVRTLRRKLPHWNVRNDFYALVKNLYFLALFYGGAYSLARLLHRRSGSRAAVLLHHRVNDYCMDAVTVDTKTFAAQLIALGRRYRPISTAELVNRLHKREAIPPTSVAIHFDDCYRDIFTNGAPLLAAAAFPAMAFINSGFVGTDREFPHDRRSSPFRHENLSRREIREWVAAGFEVGAHTISHADLGACDLAEAWTEISGCRQPLEEAADRPVEIFSYPFGKEKNIRPETAECVRRAGYTALFAAHGGFVGPDTDLYDIPRLGCNHAAKPLYLLLEMEGLAPKQVLETLKHLFRRKGGGTPALPMEVTGDRKPEVLSKAAGA